MEVEGASSSHRVACHFAEQIAAGELQPHDVAVEVVESGFSGPDPDGPPPEAYVAP